MFLLSIDGSFLQPGERATFMVTNDYFVYNYSWYTLNFTIIMFSLVLFQTAYSRSVSRVKRSYVIRTFMGRPVGLTVQFCFAVLHLVSYFDDIYFLVISTYPYWGLLLLKCLAITVVPVYCFGMAFKMSRSSLEALLKQKLYT